MERGGGGAGDQSRVAVAEDCAHHQHVPAAITGAWWLEAVVGGTWKSGMFLCVVLPMETQSDGTLVALLGTVIGMIRSFSALGESGGGDAGQLAVGISEALYNTALGIGTSSVALMMYNIFTTKIDSITYGIDESGFTLTQSFASLYK